MDSPKHPLISTMTCQFEQQVRAYIACRHSALPTAQACGNYPTFIR
jgi:hypothetical protein